MLKYINLHQRARVTPLRRHVVVLQYHVARLFVITNSTYNHPPRLWKVLRRVAAARVREGRRMSRTGMGNKYRARPPCRFGRSNQRPRRAAALMANGTSCAHSVRKRRACVCVQAVLLVGVEMRATIQCLGVVYNVHARPCWDGNNTVFEHSIAHAWNNNHGIIIKC